MDKHTHPKSLPPTSKPASDSCMTVAETAVTTEFRSGTVAEMQNLERAKEMDRREQERLAQEGPVAGMD